MTATHPPDTRRAWGVFAAATGALFLEGIDIAMLNVAVPTIASDIGLGAGSAHWVISAYVLAYAGFMILGGRVADLAGARKVFLLSLAVFVAFSLLGGLAQDAWLLIAVRFITGAAAGFMTPAGFSLVTAAYPAGPGRDRALAMYGAIGASGFLLGVVSGGLLTSLSWRLVFFAPAALGVVFLLLGWIFSERSSRGGEAERERFDVGGALTLTLAMVAFVFGVVTLGEDLASAPGYVALAVSLASFVAFQVIERRVRDPLIPAGLVSQGLLPWASAAGLLFMGSFFAWQYALTLFLQDLLGWGPLETGLVFAAMGVELVIAPLLTPRLVARFGNLAVLLAGLLCAALAFALTLGTDESAGFLSFLPSVFLLGLAFALIYGPLAGAAIEGVAEASHGVAGGVVNTGFQFGAALGVSMVTIVAAGHDAAAPALGDYQAALWVPVAAIALGVVVTTAALTRQGTRTPA